MPLYHFNRCGKSTIHELERLARDLSMKESRCRPPVHQWLVTKNLDEDLYALSYNPNFCEWPLLIQTHPDRDYKNEKVRGIIKKIITITGSTRVGDFIFRERVKDLDMKEFR